MDDLGFGVFVGDQQLGGRPVRVVQHGGTINGFTCGFWRMPAERAVVVVLDNTMSHATPALTRALAEALFAEDSPLPPSAVVPASPSTTRRRP